MSTRAVTVEAALLEIGATHGIDAAAIAAAHGASAGVVRRTPLVRQVRPAGGPLAEVLLKAENLQLTGSYKVRGALNKMGVLGPGCPGVVAASAGNHAQGLAYAARAMGVPCSIHLPVGAPVSKVAAIRELGATIHEQGETIDDCFALAATEARERGHVFVHAFDDPDIIVGQGGVGLEIVEDVPELAQVVIPVGGGGLAAGMAVAIKSRRPEVRLVGVQAPAGGPFVRPDFPSPGPGPRAEGHPPTIADGIAVKRPGVITGAVLEPLLDELVMVAEESIAEAMMWVMDQAKLVVEGAGAVSVAALLEGLVAPVPDGETVAVLSGGNVDLELIARVLGGGLGLSEASS